MEATVDDCRWLDAAIDVLDIAARMLAEAAAMAATITAVLLRWWCQWRTRKDQQR